jgi:hypothetical protein
MSAALFGYVAPDGRSIIDWHGAKLATITRTSRVRLARWSYVHGRGMLAVRARTPDGAAWYGRGSPSIAIRLRRAKGSP